MAGEVASKIAVKQVLNWFCQTPDAGPEALAAALKCANDAIVEEQHRSSEVANMRATILVLAVDNANATARWGHLGDTRLYCFRRHRIVAQTRDHSVVQGMVDAGYIEPQHLRISPRRSVLLAALGDAENFEPSIFLLCTDGLWEYIDETQMEELLTLAHSSEEWLQHLENQVLKHGRANQDNYSALVIACTEPEERTLAPAVYVTAGYSCEK